MMKLCSAACAALIALGAAVAPAQAATDDAAAKAHSCATLALAFHKSAAITDKTIALLSQGNPAMANPSMVANSKKRTDMANTLERRYGKADTDAQVAEAEAMSQKPLKPMLDASEECLK
jgi:hypothetical protein